MLVLLFLKREMDTFLFLVPWIRLTAINVFSLLFHHSIFSSLCVSKEMNNMFGTIRLLKNGSSNILVKCSNSNLRHIVKKTTHYVSIPFCSNVTRRTLEWNGGWRCDWAMPLQLRERAGQHCCRQTVHLCICKVLGKALHMKCSVGKH